MKNLISRAVVGPSGVATRWGVYTIMPILEGDLVEECVVLPVPYDKSVLDDYRIAWDDTTDCIASGCAEMYNHSDTPNVQFERDLENKILRVRALRHLGQEEELFVKYACGKWW